MIRFRSGRLLVACILGASLMTAGPATTRAKAPDRPALTRIMFTGRVTDAAGILAADQRRTLEQDLAGIEARSRHMIVVATVSTLGSQDIADYARDLGNRWGIGDTRRNDGVVILLAPNEHHVRIAVGLGLESVLTDEVCQRIIDEVMLPAFREGRFYEGLSEGVAALNARL